MSAPTRRATALRSPLALLLFIAVACADRSPPLDPEAAHPLAASSATNVVQVAPPTGDLATDRQSILTALEAVQPEGTVQFAPGTYVIGVREPGSFAFIRVTVPGVTLQGHADGTTLQGCDPVAGEIVFGSCMGIQLIGGHQTVRDLAFEHFNEAVVPGFNLFIEPPENQLGGYRIEANAFRNSIWGIRMFGQWTEPAVIHENTFVNVYSAVEVWGRIAHVTDNVITAPDWQQIPVWSETFDAISFNSWHVLQTGSCDDNLAAGNHIEDHLFGIFVWAAESQTSCRRNVIRDNVILNSQESVQLVLPAGPIWLENSTGNPDLLSHTVVEGNRIAGLPGVGVFVWFSTLNHFVDNTITDVVRAQNHPAWLSEGNGVGIWVSPSSNANQIEGSVFADVAMYDVVFEGDFNTVATIDPGDAVYDLGFGNVLTGPGNRVRILPPAIPAEATPDPAGAAGMLRERLGARGLLLGRDAAREAAPR